MTWAARIALPRHKNVNGFVLRFTLSFTISTFSMDSTRSWAEKKYVNRSSELWFYHLLRSPFFSIPAENSSQKKTCRKKVVMRQRNEAPRKEQNKSMASSPDDVIAAMIHVWIIESMQMKRRRYGPAISAVWSPAYRAHPQPNHTNSQPGSVRINIHERTLHIFFFFCCSRNRTKNESLEWPRPGDAFPFIVIVNLQLLFYSLYSLALPLRQPPLSN